MKFELFDDLLHSFIFVMFDFFYQSEGGAERRILLLCALGVGGPGLKFLCLSVCPLVAGVLVICGATYIFVSRRLCCSPWRVLGVLQGYMISPMLRSGGLQ